MATVIGGSFAVVIYYCKLVCNNTENIEFNYFKDTSFSDELLLFPEKHESVMDTTKRAGIPLISKNTESNLNMNELQKFINTKYEETIVQLSNSPAKVQSNCQEHLMNKETVHLMFSSKTNPV